jgi:hypothetical protein
VVSKKIAAYCRIFSGAATCAAPGCGTFAVKWRSGDVQPREARESIGHPYAVGGSVGFDSAWMLQRPLHHQGMRGRFQVFDDQ